MLLQFISLGLLLTGALITYKVRFGYPCFALQSFHGASSSTDSFVLNIMGDAQTGFAQILILVSNSESPIVVVLSGSMEPSIHRGDLLVLTNFDKTQPLVTGDIVVYKLPNRGVPIGMTMPALAFPSDKFGPTSLTFP